LTLHTLPPTEVTANAESATTAQEATDAVSKVQRGKSSSTPATIPRLITVAEIIKREYLQLLKDKKSPCTYGVYQYNEIGCLEDLSPSPNPGVQDQITGLKKYVLLSSFSVNVVCSSRNSLPA
jgi:hypothetical protein